MRASALLTSSSQLREALEVRRAQLALVALSDIPFDYKPSKYDKWAI